MSGGRIEVVNSTVVFHASDGSVDRVLVDEIVRVTIVRIASGLFHGEEPFYLIHKGDQVWVIPNDIPGWAAFESLLLSQFVSRPLAYLTECDSLPISWRRRVFKFLPLFPIPRSAIKPSSSLPSWPASGPRLLKDVLG